MDKPIDLTLVGIRKSIREARDVLAVTGPGLPGRRVLTNLADEAEKLADYVGQPDPAVVRENEQYERDRREVEIPDEDDDDLVHTFSMQAVVNRAMELDSTVIAYVEMTGGWVATIYAARAEFGYGDTESVRQAVLYSAAGEQGEPWGRWPIMAGPGHYDGTGKGDHVASLDEFYIGPDTELAAEVQGPPYPPPVGEIAATREDDVDSLARKLVNAVLDWEDGTIPRAEGVTRWTDR